MHSRYKLVKATLIRPGQVIYLPFLGRMRVKHVDSSWWEDRIRFELTYCSQGKDALRVYVPRDNRIAQLLYVAHKDTAYAFHSVAPRAFKYTYRDGKCLELEHFREVRQKMRNIKAVHHVGL